jgi:hypothetical protein
MADLLLEYYLLPMLFSGSSGYGKTGIKQDYETYI